MLKTFKIHIVPPSKGSLHSPLEMCPLSNKIALPTKVISYLGISTYDSYNKRTISRQPIFCNILYNATAFRLPQRLCVVWIVYCVCISSTKYNLCTFYYSITLLLHIFYLPSICKGIRYYIGLQCISYILQYSDYII